jgi:hypothetical protein
MPMGSVWRGLSDGQRNWIAVNALVVTAVINASLSALIAWAGVRGADEVPFFASTGETSIITDSLGTLFVLPLITCLLLTTVVRRELRMGKLDPVRIEFPVELAESRLLRGMSFGALTLSLLGAPVALALLLSGVGDMSPGDFVAYKAAYGVALGAVVTPVIALRAMSDVDHSAPGATSLGA